MKKYILLLASISVLVSCSSGKLSKTDAVSESETVIIGEFRILNNGKDITKNSRVYFDENEKGVLSYKLDESGQIIMKLPKGNHFVKYIYTPYGSINLPVGYANIVVPESSTAYYIGKIEIDGEGKLKKKSRGIIYDTTPKGLQEEKIKITITETPEAVSKSYREEFGSDKKVTNALMTVEK